MSKFDKYGGGTPRLPGSGSHVAPGDRVASALARATSAGADSGKADAILRGRPARIAIALDATGSMAHLLQRAKASVAEIITRATQEAGRPIAIELFAYRDYDVPQMLVDRSGCETDPHKLIAWLDTVQAAGGGANEGEAVEAALDIIAADGDFVGVLLAGDEPSNGPVSLAFAGRRNASTAATLAERLGGAKVPVHTFVVGADPRTIADFRRLSNLSGGKSGRLDGSREMIDLAVMAILAVVRGGATVRKYAQATQLSDNSRAFAQLLLGPR